MDKNKHQGSGTRSLIPSWPKSGFCKAKKDPCCYFKKYIDSYVFLLLYVDDMLIAGSSMREINNLKTRLSSAFEIKDLGPAK